MASITRLGARNVTLDLDKIASLFQAHHDLLGVPKKVAVDFAYRCDLLSDHVERHVIALEKAAAQEQIDDSPESKDQNKPETYYYGKKAVDETGQSVEPQPGRAQDGTMYFDPNDIGDDVGGPLKADPGEVGVQGHFTQEKFQELRDKEEGAGVGVQVDKFANIQSSIDNLSKLAQVSSLSGLEDSLKLMAAKLGASDVAQVKAVAAGLNKQVKAVSDVHDAMLKQEAVDGMVDPALMASASRMARAIEEQVPYLEQLLQGADEGSPIAMMEFETLVGGGSIQKLVDLATKIVMDSAKGVSTEEPAKKEASDNALLARMLEEEGMTGKSAGEEEVEEEVEEKEAKKAGEEEVEEKEEKKVDEDEDDSKGDVEEPEEDAKTASDPFFGYNLFA